MTDRSTGNPTTLITVLVLPSRLVLGQGANVDRDAAIKLLSLRRLSPGSRRRSDAAPVEVRAGRAREDWPRMVELQRGSSRRFERTGAAERATRPRASARCSSTRERSRVSWPNGVDGRIEGIAIFWEGLGSSFRARPFLFLEDLVVAETARSSGVGEALMAALAREAVARRARADRLVRPRLERERDALLPRLGGTPSADWVRYSMDEAAMRRLANPVPDPAAG